MVKSLKKLSLDDLENVSQEELNLIKLHEELRKAEASLSKEKREKEHLKQKLDFYQSELTAMEERLGISEVIKVDKDVTDFTYKPHKTSGQATAVLVLNDWHLEEYVDPNVVNGLNEYTLEIAQDRIHNVCNGFLNVLQASRTMSNIKDMVLGIIGDMMTGYIHEELVEGNQSSPVETVVMLRQHLRGVIQFMLDNADMETITIPTCRGNHGRTTHKKRIATAYANSYEWLLYQILADDFSRESRVKFVNTKGYHNLLDIQGKRVRFHHGDAVKYGGGIGGITIPIRKAISEWNEGTHADLDIMGHFHQSLFDKRFVVCNALIGFNAFCIEIKARYSRPSQTYLVIDRNRPGYVEGREIYCD